MKTVEELKAAAAAAAETLRQAEEQARAAEHEAKALAAKEARAKALEEARAKYAIFGEQLVAELRANGFPDSVALAPQGDYAEYPIIKPFGPDRNVYGKLDIEFSHHYSGGTWHQRRAGAKITVGSYGEDRKTYRQRNDGSFNFPGIAAEMKLRLEAHRAAAQRLEQKNNAKETAEEFADAVRAEHGLPDNLVVGSITSGRYASGNRWVSQERIAKPDHVLVQLGTQEVTPEQAAILVKAMREAGLLKAGE
jgi:hypothetical protein